jgi:hypothetical protein
MPTSDQFCRHRPGPRCVNDEPDDQVAEVEPAIEPVGEGAEVGLPRGQIGPRALAFIGVLGTHYHLTQFKIRDLLAGMMGVDFIVGAIAQAQGKPAQALKAPVA